MSSHRKPAVGITMMEVMVAVAILSIALLALVSVLSFSFKVQAKSEKAHTASLLAKSILNEAGHILDADFNADLCPPLPGPGPVEHPPNSGYTVEVEKGPLSTSGNLVEVTVTLTWEDANGPQSEVTATKFLREHR